MTLVTTAATRTLTRREGGVETTAKLVPRYRGLLKKTPRTKKQHANPAVRRNVPELTDVRLRLGSCDTAKSV